MPLPATINQSNLIKDHPLIENISRLNGETVLWCGALEGRKPTLTESTKKLIKIVLWETLGTALPIYLYFQKGGLVSDPLFLCALLIPLVLIALTIHRAMKELNNCKISKYFILTETRALFYGENKKLLDSYKRGSLELLEVAPSNILSASYLINYNTTVRVRNSLTKEIYTLITQKSNFEETLKDCGL